MTAEGVAAQKNNVNCENERTQADSEFLCAGGRIWKPQGFPNIVRQETDQQDAEVKEVAMSILHDQRKKSFAQISFARLANRAGWWIGPERFVIRAAIVIAGQ